MSSTQAKNGNDARDSALEQVRKAIRANQNRIYEFEIPGSNGLVARLGDMPYEKYRSIGDAAENEADGEAAQERLIALDALIHACKQVFIRLPSGELVSPDPEGECKFDKHLADALGFEFTDARATVLAVFPNDYVVVEEFNRWFEWTRDFSFQDDLVGKSEGTRLSN